MLAVDVSSWLRREAATGPDRLFCHPSRLEEPPPPPSRDVGKTTRRERTLKVKHEPADLTTS